MPAGEPFWLCHECRAEMRPIERNGVLRCASCDGEFIEILDEDVNPDPFSELPHPPTRPGQAPRSASPSAHDNPTFFQNMFNSLLGGQPGAQAYPPQGSSTTIQSLGSPAAMHGQRPPQQNQGRSYEFNIPGGGQGRIMFGGFGGGQGGGFMVGGGGGNHNQPFNPFFPGFQPPPNPHRGHTHQHQPFPGAMPQDDLLRALMEMIAEEDGMNANVLFGGMPGFGGPRGQANFGDYVTTQRGFEDVLERLMQAAGPQGPIPATEAAIEGLPRSTFDAETLEASKHKDCPVCKDDFAVGDDYLKIPCGHIFHPDCLVPWLKQNGSCPVCRYSLVPEGGNPTTAAAASPATPTAPAQPAQPQSPSEEPESFFTSILNRLWGQGGEARSPTTETAPSVPTTSDRQAQAAEEARLASTASSVPLPPTSAPAPDPAAATSGQQDAPDPALQNISSAIPDDYRARHRQREREQERRDLPHDDLD